MPRGGVEEERMQQPERDEREKREVMPAEMRWRERSAAARARHVCLSFHEPRASAMSLSFSPHVCRRRAVAAIIFIFRLLPRHAAPWFR